MAIRNILYKNEIIINNKIRIKIPTVGEIIDDENSYFNVVSLLTAMPIDLMAQLDEQGIDFTEIDSYQLFLLLFDSIKSNDTHLIFGDLDLKKFNLAINEDTNEPVLIDTDDEIVIDKLIYNKISNTLREIHHIKKDTRRPANDDAKKYMIERAKIKMRRSMRNHKERESQLEYLIVAMVNTEQFKYDYEGTRELSIYQFRESVRQIIHKVNYDNRMYGVYSGTIDANSLDDQDLNWLIHK